MVKSQVLITSTGLWILETMHPTLGNTASPMYQGTQKTVSFECGLERDGAVAVSGCDTSHPATRLKWHSRARGARNDFGRYTHHIQSLASHRELFGIDHPYGPVP